MSKNCAQEILEERYGKFLSHVDLAGVKTYDFTQLPFNQDEEVGQRADTTHRKGAHNESR